MPAPKYGEISPRVAAHAVREMLKRAESPLVFGRNLPPPPPPTFRQRMRRRLERARDAWLVLTGRAHIGDWD